MYGESIENSIITIIPDLQMTSEQSYDLSEDVKCFQWNKLRVPLRYFIDENNRSKMSLTMTPGLYNSLNGFRCLDNVSICLRTVYHRRVIDKWTTY